MPTNNSWNNTITDAAVTINTTTNALSLSSDASATTVTFATGGAAKTVTIGSTNTTSSLTLQSGTGDIAISSQDAVLIDGVGVVDINSSAGVINIGDDAVTQAMNIGTGAAARTITIGNGTDGTSVVVDCGTGALNLGTNAIARTTTLGNLTGASVLALQYGTGDFTLASASGTVMSALDTGEITKPLQPAFFAYLNADDDDVTGAGTAYTFGTNTALTEAYDQGSDFNTNGTFTAPITAKYFLSTTIRVADQSSAMTRGFIGIITSNFSSFGSFLDPVLVTDPTQLAYTFTENGVFDMDAADIATVDITIENGAGDDVDLDGAATTRISWFCGYLAF